MKANNARPLNLIVPPLEATIINLLPVPAHPDTTFDDAAFRDAVAHSASLDAEEKVNLIAAIPRLKQEQIDQIIAILSDEAEQIATLSSRLLDLHEQETAEREAVVRRASFTLLRGERA